MEYDGYVFCCLLSSFVCENGVVDIPLQRNRLRSTCILYGVWAPMSGWLALHCRLLCSQTCGGPWLPRLCFLLPFDKFCLIENLFAHPSICTGGDRYAVHMECAGPGECGKICPSSCCLRHTLHGLLRKQRGRAQEGNKECGRAVGI